MGEISKIERPGGTGQRDLLAFSCAGSTRPTTHPRSRPPRASSSPRPAPPVSVRCPGVQFSSDAPSIKLRLDCYLREIGELIPPIASEARLDPVRDLLSTLRSSFGRLVSLINDPSRLTSLRPELVGTAVASLNVARYLPVMVSQYPRWPVQTSQGLQLLVDLFQAMGDVIRSSGADLPAALQSMSVTREAVLNFDPRLFTVP